MPRSLVRTVRRLLALLSFLLLAGSDTALADPPRVGKLVGTIRDNNAMPLVNAQVSIEGTSLAATTNHAGYYQFSNLPAGRTRLRVAFIGFKTVIVEDVEIRTGQTTTRDVQLEPVPIMVDELTIVSAAESPVPRDEVSSAQSGVRGGRLDGVIALNPGVVSTPGGASGYRGSGFTTEIGTNAFDRAAVSGNSAGEFGNAQSGIVNLDGQYSYYHHPEPPGYERYNRIQDNRFLGARENPLSTFSIDVDAASYSNVRRFLNHGHPVPADAVRIEEMINYFDYTYEAPRGSDPFSITTEVTQAPWNPQHQLVLVGLKGRTLTTTQLPPSNLVFLVDVSGSMSSPDKLPLVQSAFRLLVPQLRDEDRVAIVVYAGSAGLVLPSTRGSEKETILDAIDRLSAGGSTAGGAGIQLAYRVAKENFIRGGNNRVILATDGDFNVGISNDAELVRLIGDKRREGTFLTVLGFGTGNLQDGRMEQLADKGNGQYAYIDNLNEARKVFVHETRGTLFTIAKDVKIQVEFNPALVASYRLIGYENRVMAAEDFNNDIKDAGELGAGHAVTALYEIVPPGAGVDDLRYQATVAPPAEVHTDELLTIKLRYKEPDGESSRLITHRLRARGQDATGNIRFASAVAAFGMILRNSEHRGNATPEMVVRLAREAGGKDEFGYREEFIRLVESYRQVQTTALHGTRR